MAIQKELDQFKYVPLPALPKFTGEECSHPSVPAFD